MSHVAESILWSGDGGPPTNSTRDELAAWYARVWMSGDPQLVEVVYLPEGSPEWELRMVVIDSKIVYPPEDELEPLDWSSPLRGLPKHLVLVCDTSVERWADVRAGRMRLPPGWSDLNIVRFANPEAGQ